MKSHQGIKPFETLQSSSLSRFNLSVIHKSHFICLNQEAVFDLFILSLEESYYNVQRRHASIPANNSTLRYETMLRKERVF